MLNLLQNYSVGDILIFIVVLALAFKGAVTFIDWLKDRANKYFNKEHQRLKEKADLKEQINDDEDKLASLEKKYIEQEKTLAELQKNLQLLIVSDRDDIRAWITKEHHHFVRLNKIDDYSLDCIEKRYAHYTEEGGNSYVEDLMREIRALPKV